VVAVEIDEGQRRRMGEVERDQGQQVSGQGRESVNSRISRVITES
jgi:hypothetical protein